MKVVHNSLHNCGTLLHKIHRLNYFFHIMCKFANILNY